MDKPVKEWHSVLINEFLDAWWRTRPGQYNQYHQDYDGIDEDMIEGLRDRNPPMFEKIWDEVGSQLIRYGEPEPRPTVKYKKPTAEDKLMQAIFSTPEPEAITCFLCQDPVEKPVYYNSQPYHSTCLSELFP